MCENYENYQVFIFDLHFLPGTHCISHAVYCFRVISMHPVMAKQNSRVSVHRCFRKLVLKSKKPDGKGFRFFDRRGAYAGLYRARSAYTDVLDDPMNLIDIRTEEWTYAYIVRPIARPCETDIRRRRSLYSVRKSRWISRCVGACMGGRVSA